MNTIKYLTKPLLQVGLALLGCIMISPSLFASKSSVDTITILPNEDERPGWFLIDYQEVKGKTVYLLAPGGYESYFSENTVMFMPHSSEGGTITTHIGEGQNNSFQLLNNSSNYPLQGEFRFYERIYSDDYFFFRTPSSYIKYKLRKENVSTELIFDPGNLELNYDPNSEFLEATNGSFYKLLLPDSIGHGEVNDFMQKELALGEIKIKSNFFKYSDSIFTQVTPGLVINELKKSAIKPESKIESKVIMKTSDVFEVIDGEIVRAGDQDISIKVESASGNELEVIFTLPSESIKIIEEDRMKPDPANLIIWLIITVLLVIVILSFFLLWKFRQRREELKHDIREHDEEEYIGLIANGDGYKKEHANYEMQARKALIAIAKNLGAVQKERSNIEGLKQFILRGIHQKEASIRCSQEQIEKHKLDIQRLNNDIEKHKVTIELREQASKKYREEIDEKTKSWKNLEKKYEEDLQLEQKAYKELQEQSRHKENELNKRIEELRDKSDAQLRLLESRLPSYYTQLRFTLLTVLTLYKNIASSVKRTNTRFYREFIEPVIGETNSSTGLVPILKELDINNISHKISGFKDLSSLKEGDKQVQKELLQLLFPHLKASFINKIAISYAYLKSKYGDKARRVCIEEGIEYDLIIQAYAMLYYTLKETFGFKVLVPDLFVDKFDIEYHDYSPHEAIYKLIENVLNTNEIYDAVEHSPSGIVYDLICFGYECDLLEPAYCKPIINKT
jgi:hypothetical protein